MNSDLDNEQYEIIKEYKEKKIKINKIVKVDIENYKKQMIDIDKIYSFHLTEYLGILSQTKGIKKKIEKFIENKFSLELTVKIFNDQLHHLYETKNINENNIFKDDLKNCAEEHKKKRNSFTTGLLSFLGFGKKSHKYDLVSKPKNMNNYLGKFMNQKNDNNKKIQINMEKNGIHKNHENYDKNIHNNNYLHIEDKEIINRQPSKKSIIAINYNLHHQNQEYVVKEPKTSKNNNKKQSFFFPPIKKNNVNKSKEEIINREIYKFNEEICELEMKISLLNHELLISVGLIIFYNTFKFHNFSLII